MIYLVPDQELIFVHCGNSNELFSSDDLKHAAQCFKYRDFHQAILEMGVEEALSFYKSKADRKWLNTLFDKQFLEAMAFAYQSSGRQEEARILENFKNEMFPVSMSN